MSSTPQQRWPDLAVLELLVAVAEYGGLGAAARAVGMAQPNASRAIARLEAELGLDLVTRHPRGSRLTPAGAAVADWARRVLDDARELMTASAALRADRDAHLDVAASLTVAEYLAPAWLARLRRARPELEVQLRVANSAEVFALVASGSCELGFVETPRVPTGLRSVTVADDRLAVVVAPDHPWARRRLLTPAELAATPLVVREGGSGTRATLAAALERLGIPEHELAAPSLELGSNAAVRVSAAAGAGPAVLSELAVAGWITRGDLVEVPVDGLELRRRLRAVRRANARPSDAAAELVAIARRSSRPA
ncbi:LysR family transcriptional regulator [Agromyces soli]|uniref:LysR family transcriptional regulator n=1 Tax=Agromyces soli TaxID=659012 RepID=A0ABY4AYZ5_9MICO|nr:LysR family transcriptional regulator [Agromyces soli]UOE26991.1 LysR family transcriptional regulator [Agromyces soli]